MAQLLSLLNGQALVAHDKHAVGVCDMGLDLGDLVDLVLLGHSCTPPLKLSGHDPPQSGGDASKKRNPRAA